MAAITNFIASVYDELAKVFNATDVNSTTYLQMAWPGYTLSPEDFKPSGAASAPYNSNVAEETFSALANIAPGFDKLSFINSGFEIDDLYEILISSAMPLNAAQPEVNPLYKLFANAQYEFMSARKASIDDPNSFYYACTATPGNWYDEAAAQFWASINIKSADVKPSAPSSAFVKFGGLLSTKTVAWKLQPNLQQAATVKAALVSNINNQNIQLSNKVKPANPNITTRTQPVNGAVSRALNASNNSGININDANILRNNGFVNHMSLDRANTALAAKNVPANIFSRKIDVNTVKNMDVRTGNVNMKMPADQRLILKNLLYQQLPTQPVSVTSDGFSVSFKYCRVNIDRPWLKLALLSMKNWYMFGTGVNEYSNGTGVNNTGLFPLLPTAMIVIRDLKISANWSAEDKANMQNAVSLGPFDVRNGTFNQSVLEIKGLQVIAWLSKLMPALPPAAAV